MSATQSSLSTSQTVAYEQYVRENWERLSDWEREQARAYLQAKFAYGAQAHAAQAPGWPIPVGYVCAVMAFLILPIVFAPAGIGFGIYNLSKGRTGHGVAQIALSIVCGIAGFIVGLLLFAAMSSASS